MKTVLIVEDEKLIRQGIKTMIQRSGVPVEVIVECGNGEMALEVIREQKIDVMFTDIRMPKMDGIELVRRMQECEHVPLTVAVSGYDDFSYAVEMLRNGVKEYILKPVEREKVTEIMRKLDEEIERGREKNRERKRLDYQQMKHLLLAGAPTGEELALLEAQYETGEAGPGTWAFYRRDYVVCAQNAKERRDLREENYIYLRDVAGSDVFIIGKEELELLLKNELLHGYTGVSAAHRGLRELPEAYGEALAMRKRAFCRCKSQARPQDAEEHIPAQMVQEAEKLLTPEQRMQRVQLPGTDREEEARGAWRKFFCEVKGGADLGGGFCVLHGGLFRGGRRDLPEHI